MKKEELINKVNNIYWQYTIGPQVVTKPQNLAVLTSMCSFGKKKDRGPIGVAKCLFNSEKVTLITLGGTEFKDGQATRLKESKLSGKGKDNDYLKALLKLLDEKDDNGNYIISRDNPLIISGISLGGMIAQQLLSIEGILEKFTIKSIICFGSPLTIPVDHKGIRVKRFCDSKDIVPKLSKMYLKRKIISKEEKKKIDSKERILECGNYKTLLEAHALSYVENECWDKYDFYGEINGNNKLELLEEMKFYEAPVLEQK